MSGKYKIHDKDGIYFVTLTVVHWIDLFTRKEFRHLLLDSLRFCQQQKGLIIHAWCVMPSHLHLIISSKEQALEAILRDFKKHTSREVVKLLPEINESRRAWLLNAFEKAAEDIKRVRHYKVWQDGNKPILLDSAAMQEQRLNYLHNNPVEAEVVDEPEYYWYSSARDYAGNKGLLEVSMLE